VAGSSTQTEAADDGLLVSAPAASLLSGLDGRASAISHATPCSRIATRGAVSPVCRVAKGASRCPAHPDGPHGSEVLAFLRHCEQDRHTSIGTRNCRLAALRAFFRFVTDREPTVADDCAAILRIPTKRASKPALCYLDEDEVAAILRQPDRATSRGPARPRCSSHSCTTRARGFKRRSMCVQSALRLDPPTQVRLVGKRTQGTHLPALARNGRSDSARCFGGSREPRTSRSFVNRFGRPLGAAGCASNCINTSTAAARHVPSLQSKQVSPHTFRHSVGGRLGIRWRRRDRHSKLAGPRAPRYDESLRARQPGHQARGVSTRGRQRETGQAPALETGTGTAGVARRTLTRAPNNDQVRWPIRSRTSPNGPSSSHYGLLMISDPIASLRLGRRAVQVGEGAHMLAHRRHKIL
jgi:integrase